MNFSIITEYPSWLIIVCMVVGFIYAFILYSRAGLEMALWKIRLLFAFRFLMVSLLCFLLLGPMLRTITREVEKPVIVLAVDDSQSVIASGDSARGKEELQQTVNELSEALSDKYDLRTFVFGDEVNESKTFTHQARQTDFSKLFEELDIRFLNRNVGAVIIASDGIYNSGASPVSGPARIRAPLFAIALGDTNEYRDLSITAVNHNKTAYLGNAFPIEVVVRARQASGQQTTLTVEENGEVLFSRTLQITGNRFHANIPVFLDAKSKGIKNYKITLSSAQNETALANNSREIYIEVVESKQKVLLLAQAPHPDLAAIRSSIETSPNYEVKLAYAYDFNGNAAEYNLVILHGLPSVAEQTVNWIQKWTEEGQSLWFVLSASTNVSRFNALATGMQIESATGKLNEVQAALQPDFSLFSISEELQNQVPSWPPLYSPFGIYKLNTGGYKLMQQRIGTVITDQPLFAFMQKGESRIAVLAGEGLWRWRLSDYEQHGSHHIYNELVSRTVQYLSAQSNKSPFRLHYKNSFAENEPVVFNAELYNASGQLVNEPEVRMSITAAGSKLYTYTFSRTEKAYILNAGLLPVGRYRFKADTKLGDKVYSESGEFSVTALQAELANTIADHQVLYAMASRNGGTMIFPGEEKKLIDIINNREDITSVTYQNKKLVDLIEKPWFLALLILLISVEWFLRKRSGGY